MEVSHFPNSSTYDQVFGVIGIERNNPNLTRHVKNSAKFLQSYFSNAVTPFTLPSSKNGDKTGSTTPKADGPGSARNGATATALVGATAFMIIWSYFVAI
jgi:hypothetical protein